MRAVADAGVDLDDVFQVLEDEGIQKFADSWDELTQSVRSELEDKNERTRRTTPQVTVANAAKAPLRALRVRALTEAAASESLMSFLLPVR